MDRYYNVVTRGKCNLNNRPVPGRRVTAGSYLSNFYRVGSYTPDIYTIDISFDNFLRCIRENKFINLPLYLNFNIYDEVDVSTREELMLRFQFLKYLNKFNNCSYNFYLSDSTLPAYISFMNSIGWKHDNNRFYFTIDRNPIAEKNIPLENARGKILIEDDNLYKFSNRTLSLIKNKVIDGVVVDDALKTKRIIEAVTELIDKNYYFASLSDFDKAFIVYHYLFDRNNSNIKMRPLGINYATGQTYHDKDGVQRLKPSKDRWESRAVGTFEHRSGVCSGQAKLFSYLLCNPHMDVIAEPTYGVIPSGEDHCWSSIVIDNKLYQCCTTMRGLFANLDRSGYVSNSDADLASIYPHSSLSEERKQKIKEHVRRLEK